VYVCVCVWEREGLLSVRFVMQTGLCVSVYVCVCIFVCERERVRERERERGKERAHSLFTTEVLGGDIVRHA